ncbi:MAG: complex I subunit 5 family protein [Eubacteriales bacterium]
MIDLFWSILLPIIIGIAVLLISRRIAKPVIFLLQIMMVTISLSNFLYVKANGEAIQNIGGWPDFVGISLRADLFAAVMVLLTTFLFTCMMVFSVDKDYSDNLFLSLFIILEGLMNGIFLSNDLFNLFILLEVSTVVISILIMFKRDSRSIYDGMLYLLINVVAMSFFLMGIGILYKNLGIFDLHGIQSAMKGLENADSIILPYAFIITSVSLKTALMPLFSWLPKAHGTPSAPSVVSAILSGLYVKSGVYLFIRMQTAFSSQIDTVDLFLILGFFTATVGFVLAIAQKDIKLILAYHTVSQIGLIMMAIHMGNHQAYIGGIYHIINHAFFKSTLFLTAGMIIDRYKTRDVYKIRGVFKNMPLVSIASIFAIMGITGAPFFNGSISKYWIAYGAKDSLIELGLIFINIGTLLSFIKYSQMFFGNHSINKAKEDPYENTAVMVMGGLCFVGGIFGSEFISFLFNMELSFAFMSYVEKMLAFIGSLIVGIIIYYVWLRKVNFRDTFNKLELSFNSMCLAITLFFSITLIYLKITH